MKLKKIKTVSVLEFVPPRPLMLVKRSKDLQYIDTPGWRVQEVEIVPVPGSLIR